MKSARGNVFEICCVAAILAAVAIGCKRESNLLPVRGVVFIGDKPLENGHGYVTFHPDDKRGNASLEEGVGRIQPDGSYVLETRDNLGIAPGWYKVAVSAAEVLDPANPYVTKWLMPNPEKYQDWNRSGFEVEVIAKPEAGRYDLKLPPLDAPK